MAKYRIPSNFTSAYDLISNMDEGTVSILEQELESVRVGATPLELTESLVNSNKIRLADSDIKSVIEAIYSIYGLVNNENQESVENVIRDLSKSVSETNKEVSENLEKNLLKLIKRGSRLELTHKTFELLSEYDSIYINNRILTDIRIIFNNDLKKSEQEAVIVHQLKIEYHDKGQVKNSFFALDGSDLEQLKKSIERAIEKEKLIRENSFKNISFISLKR